MVYYDNYYQRINGKLLEYNYLLGANKFGSKLMNVLIHHQIDIWTTQFSNKLREGKIKMTECPEGVVHEDCFKDIYAKFFPHGNSALYAHYVFKAFDVNCNGAISFRDLLVTLSTLLRGSVYERLRWTFKLYDINGDGCISRGELGEIVLAVHELMGRRAHQVEDDRKARDQIDRVFRKLDLNQDGVITIEEFMESCLKDDVITRSLQMFDTVL